MSQGNFSGSFLFKYSANNADNLDYELLQGYTAADLLLLYRRDASENWRMIPFQHTSNYLIATQFLPGEYTFAIGNYEAGLLAQKEDKLLLYPNPANTELHYQLPDISHLNRVEVFDALGRLVKSANVEGVTGTVNISHLPSGSYYIRFSGKTKHLTQRFVK